MMTENDMDKSEQKMDLLTVPGALSVGVNDLLDGGPTGRRKFSHKWSIVSAMSYFSDVSDEYMGGSFSGRRRTCRRSRACCVTLYAWAVLFCLACLAAVLIVTSYIGLPYFRALKYIDTSCTVTNSTKAEQTWACSCGKGCRSEYPCLQIFVGLDNTFGNISTDSNRTFNSIFIARSEVELYRQCSFYPPCKSSRAANERAVQNYKHKYGVVGQRFPCLYNPENPSEVIRTRRFHLTHVVHGLVWSSLAFLFSLSILIFAIKKKGCDFL